MSSLTATRTSSFQQAEEIQAEVKNLVVQLSAHTGEAGPTPWDGGQERLLSPWFAFSALGLKRA